MSEDTKTFVFPESANAGGLDPNLLLATMNNGGGFGGNNSWLWVIFLFFLNGWGGFGNRGGGFTDSVINNDYGRGLLLQAINGNGTAISQLASTLNCDVNAIQSAVNALSTSVQSVGAQVGMSGQQVINAIQSGNQALGSQLAQCCCDNKLLVTTQGYENQIATLNQTNTLGGKIDASTNSITSAIANQTTLLNDRFCQLEMREMQSKINALQEKNSALQGKIDNANQTQQIGQYIASAVNPLGSAIATLQGEVACMKANMPATRVVPDAQGVYLSPCQATLLGLNGLNAYGAYGIGGQWA